MNLMKGVFLLLALVWVGTFVRFEQEDFRRLLRYKPVRRLLDISYFGLVGKIRILGQDYSWRRYLNQAAVMGTLTGLLCYATVEHLVYTLIIAALLIFFLPLLFYLNLKRLAQEKTEKEVLTYVSTAIMYIREDKNSLRILRDCALVAELPLRADLERCVQRIEDSSDFSGALDELEQHYPYAQLRNLHLLLKGKKLSGGRNEQLIDYLFTNTEESELLINDYRQKKAASRSVFYFMLVLNLLAALILKKMFHSSAYVNLSTAGFRFCLFLFYLFNLATVLGYELRCSRNDKLD